MTAYIQLHSSDNSFGIPGFDDLPSHWEIRRLTDVADMRVSNVDKRSDNGELPIRLCNYVDVYKNDYIIQEIPFMMATASESEIENFRLQGGDVLITKDSEAWDDIGVPALVTEPATDLLCGYHLALLRPREHILGAYLFRCLQTQASQYQFNIQARGVTRYGLTHNGIRSVHVPLPPLPEQCVITRYLDRSDDRIQRFVSAKERLIALLEEERQAVINRAVTRGLDPNVPLKASGVEWLGDVPAHWEARRLKTLCAMRSGDSITAQSIEPTGEYPVFGGNGLRGYTSRYTHDGDFPLIGRQGALCGNVHIAHGKFWASEHAVVVSLQPEHDVKWFGAALEVMNLNQYSISAAQPGLSVERVLNLHLCVPPKEEQRRIANHLASATAAIDAKIARARRQIELMEEYRARLIADAVTGKIDVREAGAALDDVEESVP